MADAPTTAPDTSDSTPTFESTIDDRASLREIYREPSDAVLAKETETLDEGCRDFIVRSTFVLVATSDTAGRLDVSPRGGPAGFVKVLDDHRLAIPDLNGNNRLDSITNIIEQGNIALLFVIPGLGETLRINGRACITADDDVLDLFSQEVRRPKTAIGVTIEHGFIHCAKAFRRGVLWQPEQWPDAATRPSPGKILVDHSGAGDLITGEQLDELLEEGYKIDLAADAPE
ncbi:MAG: MSMEG_1061 family FMN-dependent PPOX-type flavoprotein [Actinomycetota bacterium]